MRAPVLLDTGPLVALVHRRDKYHEWAKAQTERMPAPLLTCEPVLTEACFLLSKLPGGSSAVLEMVEHGLIEVGIHLPGEIMALRKLMARYADVPMSLADACLVRLSEKEEKGIVFTLDSDFHIYRRHRRQIVPTLMPPERSR
ncbi:MAG: PIN domain-containing protein [Acidobacteria bacterium]|nr:PIN domain-containing protein [Acidobacteriota bacterium]